MLLLPVLAFAFLLAALAATSTYALVLAVRAMRHGSRHEVAPRELLDRGRPVGARDIRATVRYREYHLRAAAYRYERGRRGQVPRLWMADVERRMN